MTRKSETRQLTEDAFWAILQVDTAPTVDSVNAWLESHGHEKRDRAVISQTLKLCWGKLGERVRDTRTLPGIPEDTVALILRLREDLLAVARHEFDSQRTTIENEADARATRAREAASAATGTAEAALQAKREADSAFVTLQEEHQRVVGESKSLRAQLEDSSRQIAARDVQLGQAREALESEQRERQMDRDGAQVDSRRQANEIDDLRTLTKAQTLAYDRTLGKAQTRLDASEIRERDLREENARLQAEIGALRGAERVLKDRVVEVTAEVAQSRSEATTNIERAIAAEEQAHSLVGRIGEKEAELESRSDISPEQLRHLLVDTYTAGAISMVRLPKGKDPAEGLQARAEEYATHRATVTPRSRSR